MPIKFIAIPSTCPRSRCVVVPPLRDRPANSPGRIQSRQPRHGMSSETSPLPDTPTNRKRRARIASRARHSRDIRPAGFSLASEPPFEFRECNAFGATGLVGAPMLVQHRLMVRMKLATRGSASLPMSRSRDHWSHRTQIMTPRSNPPPPVGPSRTRQATEPEFHVGLKRGAFRSQGR